MFYLILICCVCIFGKRNDFIKKNCRFFVVKIFLFIFVFIVEERESVLICKIIYFFYKVDCLYFVVFYEM